MTRRTLACLPLLPACLSVADLAAAGKKAAGFQPGPAVSYPNHRKNAALVAAAAAYLTQQDCRPAFGKLVPYQHGVLPILLIIENVGSSALNLQGLRVSYIDADRRSIDDIPAKDVPFLRAPQRPSTIPTTPPIPGVSRKNKNPLAAMEIESRAFSARMLPAGESAHGFFYFQAEHRPGAVLYITGIQQARTGQDILFLDVPIDEPRNR